LEGEVLEIGGFSAYRSDDAVIIDLSCPLDLDRMLGGGQCFTFGRIGGAWRGAANGRSAELSCADGRLAIRGADVREIEQFWLPYLALDMDYGAITAGFAGAAPALDEAVGACAGLRVLRQDPYEALVTFILSQNNNIPRIRTMVRRVSQRYGKLLPDGQFAFPDAQTLASAGAEDLHGLGLGYRAEYVASVCGRIASGELGPYTLRSGLISEDECRARLLGLPGVGPKVAACVMLFGLGFYDAFPIDVWMRRIIDERFGGRLDTARLSPWAGIAQQYLFEYYRK